MDPRALVFGEGATTISRYVDILTNRGIEWGLLGPREVPRIWDRHVLNCVAGSSFFPEGASVVDVGSGAGLPGIPLAVMRPDLSICLVDSLLRRFEFLQGVVVDLGLGSRVSVVRCRAEELTSTFDVVTCRAVAPLSRLVEWCDPLLAPRGRMVLLKGASCGEELATASTVLKRRRLSATVHSVPVPETSDTTWIVQVNRDLR